ncbi:YycH protein [Staphylococcus aureus]|nr:YycH protein [Staphylococcus aureus]
MQPYTDIITNKDTIDRTTHVFAPSKPEKLKTYRMVFNTISVEKMNAILFDDSTIVRKFKEWCYNLQHNTGVRNYNDKMKNIIIKTCPKMKRVPAKWKNDSRNL